MSGLTGITYLNTLYILFTSQSFNILTSGPFDKLRVTLVKIYGISRESSYKQNVFQCLLIVFISVHCQQFTVNLFS